MPTTIDIESQRMLLGSTPVRKIYHGQNLLGMRIAELFANGEQGVWYDPSDFSTMFQDSAGATPVTAVKQPVGLILDKSKGLVLGPELVTNGTFDTDINGWIVSPWFPSSTAVEWSNGALHVYNTQAAYGESRSAAIPLTIGKQYVLEMDILEGTTDRYWIIIGSSASNDIDGRITVTNELGGTSPSGYKRWRYQFVAAYATAYLYFATNSLAGSHLYADNISVRELPGNHASQRIATSRPVLRQDGNGKHYLYFDGVDDFLVTPTITPGIDKVQVFAGLRKLSDASAGVLIESSEAFVSNAGSFLLGPRDWNASTGLPWLFASQGSVNPGVGAETGPYAASITQVISGLGDISGDRATLRVNGTQAASSTADQGAGNYLAYPLYIGRRGGASLPFNGHIYSLIVRFGSNLPIATIEKTEKYINEKTRAY